jgi:integrase
MQHSFRLRHLHTYWIIRLRYLQLHRGHASADASTDVSTNAVPDATTNAGVQR